MTQDKHLDVTCRHEFVMLFDVTNGNPNGDPDAGNLPRTDPETGHGIVTDVALKRKVRLFVETYFEGKERYGIYVKQGEVLNERHEQAYKALGIKPKGTKQQADDIHKTQQWICDHYFDTRAFGAVMTTGVNCGQVRGPIQLTFARSITPILGIDATITRMAITKRDSKKDKIDEAQNINTMGRKAYIPYGLYCAFGFFVPPFAAKTGFTSKDLEVFWQALQMMWELDRSASRGLSALRGLYVFSHDSDLGSAPSSQLLESITVEQTNGGAPPRSFRDYTVTLPSETPEGVTLTSLVG